jgi:tetratricopeptide (TPR) repeat protein
MFKTLRLAALLALAVTACADSVKTGAEHADRGDAYLAKKQYSEAILEYLNALKADPALGRAHLNLARAYAKTENYEEAYVEYMRAADLFLDDLDVQVEAGNILLLGRMFNDAKERARRIVEKDPKHVAGLLLLGNSLAGLQDLENAVAVTERAIKASPERGGTYANLGTLQLARGNRAEAEAAFLQAVAINPTSVSARLSLANFYRAVGQVDKAEQRLQEAVAIDESDYRANLALASFYIDTNLSSRAGPYLRKVAEGRNDAEAWLDLAAYLVSQRQPDEALKVLEKVATDPANYVTARTRMATITHSAGRPGDAHKIVAEILRRYPGEPRALAVSAQLFLAERRLDNALANAREAIERDPNGEEGHFVMARVHLAREQLEPARRSLREVLRLDPTRLEAMIELSRIHARRDELDTAIQTMKGALRIYPYSVPARAALVQALLKRPEDRLRAFEEVQALVRHYPSSPEARATLGSYYVAVGDIPAARREFERTLMIDPAYYDALAQLVALDIDAGRPRDAYARLRGAYDKQPNEPAILLLTAKVAWSQGQLPETEFMLRRLIAVDPSNLEAYELLGRLYVSVKQLPAATKAFHRILDHDPKSSAAHTMLGLLYHAQRDLPKAVTHYEKAFESNPDSATAANNLAWILTESDLDLERALELARAARAQLPDDPTIADTLGWVLLKREMIPMATTALEDAVRLAPNNALYSYHLGVTYARGGEDAKARKALERALTLDRNFALAADAKKILSKLVY